MPRFELSGRGLTQKMKKITSTEEFHFVHDGKESFDLGKKPVEVSDEAYAHLTVVFGPKMFQVVGEKKEETKTND